MAEEAYLSSNILPISTPLPRTAKKAEVMAVKGWGAEGSLFGRIAAKDDAAGIYCRLRNLRDWLEFNLRL